MFHIVFEDNFAKDLKKIDKSQAKLVLAWIKKNLDGVENPRILGKALQGNLKTYWRYRIGKYRLIAEIVDNKFIIICLAVGHRKDIYKK